METKKIQNEVSASPKIWEQKQFSKLSCMEIPDESMGVLHAKSFQNYFLYVNSIAL